MEVFIIRIYYRTRILYGLSILGNVYFRGVYCRLITYVISIIGVFFYCRCLLQGMSIKRDDCYRDIYYWGGGILIWGLFIEGSVYISTCLFWVVSILELLPWNQSLPTQRSGTACILHIHITYVCVCVWVCVLCLCVNMLLCACA